MKIEGEIVELVDQRERLEISKVGGGLVSIMSARSDGEKTIGDRWVVAKKAGVEFLKNVRQDLAMLHLRRLRDAAFHAPRRR